MTDKFADYATVEDFQPAAASRNAEAGEMSAIDSSSVALEMPAGPEVLPDSAPAGNGEIRVQGKFFFAGNIKHFVKGVTYGPFGPGSHGAQFPEVETVAHDFALMRSAGANTVRVFTVPPVWLLDAAEQAGSRYWSGCPGRSMWPSSTAPRSRRRSAPRSLAGCAPAVVTPPYSPISSATRSRQT